MAHQALEAPATAAPLNIHARHPADLLSAEQVSALTGIRTTTLANWRNLGTGPKFYKLGDRAVRYKAGDVAAFVDAGAHDCRNTAASEGSAA